MSGRGAVAAIVVVVALMSTGCSSTYTEMMRNDDGTYMLTRIRVGVFKLRSEVQKCHVVNAEGDLECDVTGR